MALSVQQKLDAALLAYHQLNTGTLARVFVDQNGERVEYTATNRAALYAYIQQLRDELNPGTVPASTPRPIRYFF